MDQISVIANSNLLPLNYIHEQYNTFHEEHAYLF